MSKYHPSFSVKQFEELRLLRNRCMHPGKEGHISSDEIGLLEEVSQKLPVLEMIAKLLLDKDT